MTQTALKLVIFDVDGTLVDSQADILLAMAAAFNAVGAALPPRDVVLGIVGLSLDVALPTLAPDRTQAEHAQMVAAYKDSYMESRKKIGAAQSSPLYPGALAALRALQGRDEVLLGIATGKSRRGLDKLIEGHGLEGLFLTQQCADFHPSKPHPSMILAALSEMGVTPDQAVMVGDTSFDMQMAQAAGIGALGVSWGYHDTARLTDADVIIDSYDALAPALDQIWSIPA
tara:strand:- start:401 stop:1087 length:687 start_codon:yes stop_codon:yes gene_type:complete